MALAIWIVVCFFLGAVPFALIVSRLGTGKDIRLVGDGNPGTANAWKASGWRWGVTALILETLKGALPVLCAMKFGDIQGWALFLVGISPVLGHAYSPFLKFRGGKANAVTSGIWGAITPYGLGFPLAFVCISVFHALQTSHSWTVILGFTMFGALAIIWLQQEYLAAIWAVNLGIGIRKHWDDLKGPVSPRPWLRRMLGSTN